METEARKAYNAYTANHPTIHCNRFPSWDELTDQQKQDWIDKVKK